ELEHLATLDRHRLGHREDEPVTAGRRDEREADARVPRRGLDEHGLARQDFPGRLERLDHRDPDAILDRMCGVEKLQFRRDGRAWRDTRGHAVELNEWRV